MGLSDLIQVGKWAVFGIFAFYVVVIIISTLNGDSESTANASSKLIEREFKAAVRAEILAVFAPFIAAAVAFYKKFSGSHSTA